MTHAMIRRFLAGMMMLSSLLVLRNAARAYGARKGWQGIALMGAGFLLMGLVGLRMESRDELGGTLTLAAGVIVMVGSLVGNGERGVGVG